MFEKIKTQARCAMLISKKKSSFPFLFAGLYWLASHILMYRFGLPWSVYAVQAVLIFVFISVSELYFQIKLILSAKGKEDNEKFRFSYACRACVMRIMILFYKLRNLIIYELLPLLLLLGFAVYIFNYPLSLKAFYVIVSGIALLLVLGAVFALLSFQKYSRAMFLLAAYPLLSASDAIRLSRCISDKEDNRLTLFKFSFIPWFLACVFIIPLPFVILYYKQSITCYFLSR